MCFIYKSTRDDEMQRGITERETKGKRTPLFTRPFKGLKCVYSSFDFSQDYVKLDTQ